MGCSALEIFSSDVGVFFFSSVRALVYHRGRVNIIRVNFVIIYRFDCFLLYNSVFARIYIYMCVVCEIYVAPQVQLSLSLRMQSKLFLYVTTGNCFHE